MSTIGIFLLFLKDLPKYLFSRGVYKTKLDGLSIYVHPRSSVYAILKEVFVDNIYKPNEDIMNVNIILDLGGYIGDFAVWANSYFKPKKIICLEPNKKLMQIAKMNVKENKMSQKTVLINKAIFNKNTRLSKNQTYNDAETNYFIEDAKGGVKTITLADIVKKYNLKRIDYFKMDIEGGEKFVFTEENKLIFKNKVRFISFETHEAQGFGQKDAKKYLKSLGFDVVQTGARGQFNQFEAFNRGLN